MIRSGIPSPSTSAAATWTPPVKAAVYGRNDPSRPGIGSPVFPSSTWTRWPPGPRAVTTSGNPSPVKSAVATRTPPAKAGSAIVRSNVRSPVTASNARTTGGGPIPVPV
ncbi:MAG TPA: hypothetical protein VH092_08105 [Urbifossiella sp.]|nr:hypothetical protein [Urbifossiella sp.]